MNLSISNIAWGMENNEQVYRLMKDNSFLGLEIAPTKIIPETPYQLIDDAVAWKGQLAKYYGFQVPSMQSIWYGRTEKIFEEEQQRKVLLDYTKQAIDFAAAIGCSNLVFGCPKNRVVFHENDKAVSVDFFHELGEYAASKGTVIGMEANPEIYHTNYITDTKSAIELIKEVNSDGFKLNLDVGTMIYNNESISDLYGYEHLINHVHISEPHLVKIEKRKLHIELAEFLKSFQYSGYVSIEMGQQDNLKIIAETMKYVKEIFNDL